MKFITQILYIEFTEAVCAGISQNTLFGAKYRNDKCWKFIDDPEDKRKVLIEFESLKSTYKKLIYEKYGDPYQYAGALILKQHIRQDQTSFKFLLDYRLSNGTGLPQTHIETYTLACNYLRFLSEQSPRSVKQLGFPNMKSFYTAVISLIDREKIQLPVAYTRLLEKVREFIDNGAACVVSKKFGNNNTAKINEAISEWLIAQYAQINKPDTAVLRLKYLQEAKKNSWEPITESAIYQHLHKPEIMPIWYMGRHGYDEWKKRYEHTNSLYLPTFRDAMWCGDGTKLNFYYQVEGKRSAKLNIYIVMDVFSELVLGYDVTDEAENFLTQYRSFKMALQFAAAKPYQLLYDNQGGHKKKETQDFFKRAAEYHFPSRPYRSSGRPIEHSLGRMQKQVMRKYWFCTGQNITTKSVDSHANMEFIKKNFHELPTREDLLNNVIPAIINEWNNATHPKHNSSRLELYKNSVNPKHQPLDILDMVDLFWHTTAKPITYRGEGLRLEIGNKVYLYEVVDENDLPDLEFLSNYTQVKFFVKYDPDDMDEVRLYREVNNDLRFVAAAQPKMRIPRALIDRKEGDRDRINNRIQRGDDHKKHIESQLQKVRINSGVSPEDLLKEGHHASKYELVKAKANYYEGIDTNDDDEGLRLEDML